MAVRAFQTLDFRNVWIEFTRVNDKSKGNEVAILVTYVALCVRSDCHLDRFKEIN